MHIFLLIFGLPACFSQFGCLSINLYMRGKLQENVSIFKKC